MAPKVRERAVGWLRQLSYFVVEPAGSRVITPYDPFVPPDLLRQFGAGDGIRTRDQELGKLLRYHCATPAFDLHLNFFRNRCQAEEDIILLLNASQQTF